MSQQIGRVFLAYLAGPDVFLPDAAGRGAELKALCAASGLEGLFPLDGEISGIEDVPGAIRAANMDLIRRCDVVLANMAPFRGPSMDPGTAYEMGAGAALGKLVVGYTSDPRSYVERVSAAMPVRRTADGALRDAEGMSVEEFGQPLADNLMMARGVDALFATVEEAVAHAAVRLGAAPAPAPAP